MFLSNPRECFYWNSLTKETGLEFMGIFCWLFYVNILLDMNFIIILKLQTSLKFICSPLQFSFYNFIVLSFFFVFVSQNTNIKPSQVVLVEVILDPLRRQSLKKKKPINPKELNYWLDCGIQPSSASECQGTMFKKHLTTNAHLNLATSFFS